MKEGIEIWNVLIDFCVNKVEVEMEFYKSYVRPNKGVELTDILIQGTQLLVNIQ